MREVRDLQQTGREAGMATQARFKRLPSLSDQQNNEEET